MAAERLSTDESLAGLRVILTVHSASGLVAKDRNMFGKKTSSDPYAKVYFGDKAVGKTAVKKKTLEPVWETRVKHTLGINDAERVRHAAPSASSAGAVPSFVVALFDHDVASADDPMGQVTVPVSLNGIAAETFQVVPGRPKSRGHCKNAKGTIKISVQVSTVLLPDIVAGNVLPLQMAKKHSRLRVGLGWNVTRMQKPIDLDLSCVAIDARGKVSMDETVYFSNLQNPSGSIVHSGDEREGSARVLGSDTDDREQITIDMDRLPAHVAAYVLLATVATPSTDFSEITSARVRVIDGHDGLGFCAFRPAFEGACTALFCLRLSREPKGAGPSGRRVLPRPVSRCGHRPEREGGGHEQGEHDTHQGLRPGEERPAAGRRDGTRLGPNGRVQHRPRRERRLPRPGQQPRRPRLLQEPAQRGRGDTPLRRREGGGRGGRRREDHRGAQRRRPPRRAHRVHDQLLLGGGARRHSHGELSPLRPRQARRHMHVHADEQQGPRRAHRRHTRGPVPGRVHEGVDDEDHQQAHAGEDGEAVPVGDRAVLEDDEAGHGERAPESRRGGDSNARGRSARDGHIVRP
ncbi:hypothetical protein THAOC_35499, partial [Thalassiosira oceanica]